jgi:two-component system phosphate regulon sensor histidine kinase PhoR
MKKKKKLVWLLFLPYLTVILIALIATTWYASRVLKHFHLEHTRTDLKNQAYLAKQQVLHLILLPDPGPLNDFCKQVGRRTSTRLTVILPSGRVVADSFENPGAMENHDDRPEIIDALTGKTGTAIRYSETLTQTLMYVALPFEQNGAIGGVIRASIPLTAIEKQLSSIRFKLIFWGGIIAMLAAVISLGVAQRISRPIGTLRNGAERFAKGEFSHRLPVSDSAEITDLTVAMNQMAAQLDERITTIINQRKELEAVLASMLEGVVAVDAAGEIMNLNPATARIFDTSIASARGKTFMEISRNHRLHEFVQQAVVSTETLNHDIVLTGSPEDKSFNVHSTPILDETDARTGTLIVFNDVTKLKRLENIRQDFVANVSHEIKTPLTAIKGFVETLHYGSVDDLKNTRHFLGIIERHVNRLNTILEDLLTLSRLEQKEQQNGIQLKRTALKSVLQTAIQVCQTSADKKNITLEMKCSDDIFAEIDETLIEQALINLVDNAIKYSSNNRPVHIEAITGKETVTISIRDHGPGIPKKHIPRLFERFYRVDKARSRDLGGTGLGLSIVKHIVNVHGGQITVASTPGEGSNFIIHLPRKLTEK